MDKLRFYLISALFSLLFVFGTALILPAQESPKFLDVYRAALELNKDRFENLDLIYVGDTILVPSINDSNVTTRIAQKPDPVTKRHDCIWYISERHAADTVVTLASNTVQVQEPAPEVRTVTPIEAEDEPRFPWWALLLALVALAVIAILIFIENKRVARIKQKNL